MIKLSYTLIKYKATAVGQLSSAQLSLAYRLEREGRCKGNKWRWAGIYIARLNVKWEAGVRKAGLEGTGSLQDMREGLDLK